MSDTIAEPTVIERLAILFEGYDGAYGTYDAKPGGNSLLRGKVEIKSSARTVRQEVTIELWEKHVRGEVPLGIIPIRDNDTALWGCIDIDQYGISHADIVKRVKKLKLPLVVCRSKSGGAHVFLFLNEPAPAGDVQDFLREVSVLIGWGNSEVFPKQRTVLWERGDLGSWLNMPYFSGDESERYGVALDGLGMTLRQFVDYAEANVQPLSVLIKGSDDFRDPDKPKPSADFGDGPPCMQHLSSSGYPEGTRNKGLFAMGVFAKKKYGVRWAETLEQWNRDFMDPPLPASEVTSVIRSLEKKDFYYPCKEQPLVAHCNSSICRTRRFGVGGDDDYPQISALSVLDTDPPLWYLDVEGFRVELTTEELQNYRTFHRVCMEQLFKCYRMMKQDDWLQIIGSLMPNAVRIEAPKEVGRSGQFKELLDGFLTDRHVGESREDLLLGRPFKDDLDGRYYFRLQDLQSHLENKNFRAFSRGQITGRLRQMHGNSHAFNVKGKYVNVFYVPVNSFESTPVLSTPKIDADPL